jgi:superfamily II DNA or RNA helicase
MLRLELDSLYLNLREANSEVLKVIDQVTSYAIEGAWFSSAFRNKTWDGRQHLLSFSRANGYRVYGGCAADVVAALRNEHVPFEYVDLRKVPEPTCDHGWTGLICDQKGKLVEFQPRDYQVAAARAVLTETLPLGRGMLKLPIRSGKTCVGALIIAALQVPAIFIVTNDLLLQQTVRLYESMFSSRVGVIGAGRWDPTDLTVATVQTLHSRVDQPEFKQLMERADLVVFDEVHHLQGSTKAHTAPQGAKPKAKKASGGWKDIALRCNAYYKIGLSATIYIDVAKAAEKSAIWLKAATGSIAYEVTTKRMIEEGWLLRPIVEMHRVVGPQIQGDWAEDEVYRRGVVNYARRNQLILGLTMDEVALGGRIMVHAHHHEHIDALHEMLEGAGAKVEKLSGKVHGQERKEVMVRFRRGKTQVLVGNIFGEGLDVPEVDVVVNAEGGESRKRSIQRLRNLTPSPGKKYVKVIDFLDEHEAHLAKHARARLKAYRAEDAFDVRVVG